MDFLKTLQKQAAEYPEKPAIIFRDMPITFAQLKEFSLKVAAGLSGLGVTRPKKVAIFLPNVPEYIYSFLGIYILRGVAVPLDFMLTEEEIVTFINHSESEVLIAQEKKGVDFQAVKARCARLKRIIIFGENNSSGECLSWAEFFSGKVNLPKIDTDELEPSSIFYTSGSTGHPKGVLLSYAHFDIPVETLKYFLEVSDKDSFICAGVPFSHVGGLDYMLFMLYFGTTLILMERFHPLEFLKNMEKHKVAIFCIVPSMYVAVLSLKEYDKFDLSSLRYAVVFGAPSSPALLERFLRVCPNAYLLNGWGLTETAAPNGFLPTGTSTKEIAHTGTFTPGLSSKIVDDEGKELPDGSDGELWLKGKAVMLGYYKEPQLTQEVLDPDGWFKTGDIARRDSHGRLAIVGRKKEMIKVGGEIVFCPEVEEVIHRYPKVQEVAVIGVADKMRGEVPKAFIVPKPGEQITDEELRYFLREHTAHFKIPHHFAIVESLPKNRVGKIDKESLKKIPV